MQSTKKKIPEGRAYILAEKQNKKPARSKTKVRAAASKGRKEARREQLLKSIGVEELFEEGSIQIDKKTCKGVECQLCMKACPTNALYWKMGEVGLVEDLCIYCTSCVLNCIVDDCIVVKRKRNDGTVESFSTPGEALALLRNVNNDKRVAVIGKILLGDEAT
jgi:Fe-S-cluster-containing hydrogenase component 2